MLCGWIATSCIGVTPKEEQASERSSRKEQIADRPSLTDRKANLASVVFGKYRVGQKIERSDTIAQDTVVIGKCPFAIGLFVENGIVSRMKLSYKYTATLGHTPNDNNNVKVAVKRPAIGTEECLPAILESLERQIGKADSYDYCKLPQYENLCKGAEWVYEDGKIVLYILESCVSTLNENKESVYTSYIMIDVSRSISL